MSISHTTKIQDITSPVDNAVQAHIVNKRQVPRRVTEAAPARDSLAVHSPIIQPN